MESRLLDLRDCTGGEFAAIQREMLRLDLEQQPRWFRPLLVRSKTLKRWTGYDHWSRAWEYPWAILAAGLGERDGPADRPLRVLDVGGGGSPFALYLARRWHEACVADPSLDRGASFVFDPNRSLYRNVRSLLKRLIFRATGINSLWGLPDTGEGRADVGRTRVCYLPYAADRLEFPDQHFDRVFCLSVMEHIPADLWGGCMAEFQRVLKPGGRLVLTLDMTTPQANERLYLRLVRSCPLRLIGDPGYQVPIDADDQRRRHPGHGYETIGLVWQK
ncbi:MAG: class I SAM-dependent methyltransferase [Acidobacteria bacterium]|nr:class I SAM-dependent methyltransferase [Acidobacteriota bacterium]